LALILVQFLLNDKMKRGLKFHFLIHKVPSH
jgi:hypothetical protein